MECIALVVTCSPAAVWYVLVGDACIWIAHVSISTTHTLTFTHVTLSHLPPRLRTHLPTHTFTLKHSPSHPPTLMHTHPDTLSPSLSLPLSLLLTTFCLEHRPTVVACVSIHLACHWKGLEVRDSQTLSHFCG